MFSAGIVRCASGLLCGSLLLVACAGLGASPPAAVQPSAAPARATAVAPAPTAAIQPATALPSATAVAPSGVPTELTLASPTATPNPIVDPITGAPALARGALTRRPFIVMIDNHPDAYPQTGLDHAAVVFEALAEFGITRFMALYAPGITPEAPEIGPVRSTRLYFAQWAMGFHPVYAHAGGSPQGLALVENTDELTNLDAEFKVNIPYFWRSKDRVAPHNLYTSSANLEAAAADLGVAEFDRPEVGFLFKADAPEDQRPASQQLGYFFLYPEDDAGWNYDPATNGYLRLRRGRAARDAASGEQLWTKNVVVIEVSEGRIPGDEKGRIDQEVIGTGEARIFMDGVERAAKWRKDDPAAPLRFYDASDAEVELNAGPVWIAALPSIGNLTSQ